MNFDRFKEPEEEVLSDLRCANCGNMFYVGDTVTKNVDEEKVYCDTTCYLLGTTTEEVVIPERGLLQ